MNDTTPLDIPPTEPRRRFSARPILIGAGSAIAVLALGFGGFALADSLDDADDRLVITSSPTTLPSPTPSPSSSFGDDGCVVVSDDDCVVATQSEYAAVTAAALAAVGGGTVIEVDRGDSPGDAAWKVEIRLANGDEAEVRLDANLNLIRVDLDNDDNSGSDDSGSDDSGHGGDDNSGDDNGGDNSGSGSDDD